MSLLVKFNLILILCFGIALVPAHLITRHLLQKNARDAGRRSTRA